MSQFNTRCNLNVNKWQDHGVVWVCRRRIPAVHMQRQEWPCCGHVGSRREEWQHSLVAASQLALPLDRWDQWQQDATTCNWTFPCHLSLLLWRFTHRKTHALIHASSHTPSHELTPEVLEESGPKTPTHLFVRFFFPLVLFPLQICVCLSCSWLLRKGVQIERPTAVTVKRC